MIPLDSRLSQSKIYFSNYAFQARAQADTKFNQKRKGIKTHVRVRSTLFEAKNKQPFRRKNLKIYYPLYVLRLHRVRRVNVFVMECLVDVMGSRPLALVWLKRNISLETCKTILKDEKYKGTFYIVHIIQIENNDDFLQFVWT